MKHKIRYKNLFEICISIQYIEIRLSNKLFNFIRIKASGYEIVSLLKVDIR